MSNIIYLKPNPPQGINVMEVLKQHDPKMYEYFITKHLELTYIEGDFRVIGEDFEASFDLFIAITVKTLRDLKK